MAHAPRYGDEAIQATALRSSGLLRFARNDGIGYIQTRHALNRLDPHPSDARSPEAERVGGLERNVDDPATDERAAANDRDDRAQAVIEVDDSNLRPHRQGAMRRRQRSVTRIMKI